MVLPPITVDVALVVSLAAILISLIASYIPGFREWWAGLEDVVKQLGMLISITLICLGVGVLSWTGVWLLIPAGKDGIVWLVIIWIQALVANQGAYKFSPQLSVVRAIKDA